MASFSQRTQRGLKEGKLSSVTNVPGLAAFRKEADLEEVLLTGTALLAMESEIQRPVPAKVAPGPNFQGGICGAANLGTRQPKLVMIMLRRMPVPPWTPPRPFLTQSWA